MGSTEEHVNLTAVTEFVKRSQVLAIDANIMEKFGKENSRLRAVARMLSVRRQRNAGKNLERVKNKEYIWYNGRVTPNRFDVYWRKEKAKNKSKLARDWGFTLAHIQVAIAGGYLPGTKKPFEVGKCYKIDGKDESGSYATKGHYSFWIEKVEEGVFRVAIVGLNTAVLGEEKGGDWGVGGYKKGKKHSVYFEVTNGQVTCIQEATLVKEKTVKKMKRRRLRLHHQQAGSLKNHVEKVRSGTQLMEAGRKKRVRPESGDVEMSALPMILEEKGEVIYPGERYMLDEVIGVAGRNLSSEDRKFIARRMKEDVASLRGDGRVHWYHGDIKPENFVVVLNDKGEIADVQLTDWDGLRNTMKVQAGDADIRTPCYLPPSLQSLSDQDMQPARGAKSIMLASLSRDAYALMLSMIQVEVGDIYFGFIEDTKEPKIIYGFDENSTANYWYDLVSGVDKIICNNHVTQDESVSDWIINLTEYLLSDEEDQSSEKYLKDEAQRLLGGSQFEQDATKLLDRIKEVRRAIHTKRQALNDKQPQGENKENKKSLKELLTQGRRQKLSKTKKRGKCISKTAASSGVLMIGGGVLFAKPLVSKQVDAVIIMAGLALGVCALGRSIARSCCSGKSQTSFKTHRPG